MELYENIFIARQDLTTAQVNTLNEKFTNILRDQGGTIVKTEHIGLKSLAYLIKNNRKGHYVLNQLTSTPQALKEFERVMSLNEDILRFLTVKVDEHERGPSALLKASRYQRDEYEEDRPTEGSEQNDKSEAI